MAHRGDVDVSFLLLGDYSLSSKLREATANELIEHNQFYAKHDHLERAAKCMDTDLPTVLQSLTDATSIPNDLSELKIKEGRSTNELNTWSSMIQVLALSSVIGKKIVSAFPDLPHYAQSLYDAEICPRIENNSYNLQDSPVILWTRENLDNKASVFVPDHVVPLVKAGDNRNK